MNRAIRVNCRNCGNCTGEGCKPYGDDPAKAAKNCAHDNFVNYIPKERKKNNKNNKGGRKHGTDRNR